MSNKEKIFKIIFVALESLNEELPDDQKVIINAQTALFGDAAALDSLSLVSVIVDVESAISTEFDYPIALTDDRAMNREISPFDTVQTLADYIEELLAEKK